LKSEKIGLISNGDSKFQREKLNKLKLISQFTTIVISGDIGIHKPDKELFYYACKKANENVENSFYIGDNFETDIIGAINAGMKGIWLNRFNCKTEDKDILQISGLNELNNNLNFK